METSWDSVPTLYVNHSEFPNYLYAMSKLWWYFFTHHPGLICNMPFPFYSSVAIRPIWSYDIVKIMPSLLMGNITFILQQACKGHENSLNRICTGTLNNNKPSGRIFMRLTNTEQNWCDIIINMSVTNITVWVCAGLIPFISFLLHTLTLWKSASASFTNFCPLCAFVAAASFATLKACPDCSVTSQKCTN